MVSPARGTSIDTTCKSITAWQHMLCKRTAYISNVVEGGAAQRLEDDQEMGAAHGLGMRILVAPTRMHPYGGSRNLNWQSDRTLYRC